MSRMTITNCENLVDRVFGRWTVVGGPEIAGSQKWACRAWLCKCTCGAELWIREQNLRSGCSRGCRECRNRERFDPSSMVGQTYGQWTVVRLHGTDSKKENFLLWCRCECGAERQQTASCLRTKRAPICTHCLDLAKANVAARHRWKKFLWAASKRRLPVEISLEEANKLLVKQGFKCALTGLPISQASNLKEEMSGCSTASIDRIDSSRGYLADNVQWVHKDINRMKWEFSHQRFIELCRAVVSYNSP